MALPKLARRFLPDAATATHLVGAHAAARALDRAIGSAHLLDLLGSNPGLPTRADLVTRICLNDDPDLRIHVRRCSPIYAYCQTRPETPDETPDETTVMSIVGDPESRFGRRSELEIGISRTPYASFENLAFGRTLVSTRYCAILAASSGESSGDSPEGGDGGNSEIAIEIFDDEFAGLVVVEARLPREDCRPTGVFKRSDLFAREITNDRRFDWQALARIDIADIAAFLAETCSKPRSIPAPEIRHA